MRRYVLLFAVLIIFINSKGQTPVFTENFETNTSLKLLAEAGWNIGGGAQVNPYDNPSSSPCTSSMGLQTPGIGGKDPVRILSPVGTYLNASPIVAIRFDLYVFDANLNCVLPPKDFPCATQLTVYLMQPGFNSLNTTPDVDNSTATVEDDAYAYQTFPLTANGHNSLVFNAPAIPNNAGYRVLLDFKGTQLPCQQGNTKYILDNFNIVRLVCDNCVPLVNPDYFNSQAQGFSTLLKANLFGGNLKWASQIDVAYSENSLNQLPAIDYGTDRDLNDPDLSIMQYNLVPNSLQVDGCGSAPNMVNFALNTDGTFLLDRDGNECVSRITFQYTLTNTITALTSGAVTVTIDFPSPIPLPVSFRSFNANRDRQNVTLNWETATEQNNRGFYVQRNTRGVWENIAFVFSAADGGNSSDLLKYAYKDLNNEKGVSQYRIQQVDMDGRASYSVIRSVRGLEMAAKTLVYPNPSDNGKLSVVFNDQGHKNVVVSDMSGRAVRQYRGVVNNLAIEGLESGMYSIQITDLSSGVSTTEKVIIKKR